MATYDAADLLSRLQDVCGRPATDTSLTSTRGYRYLSDAQLEVAYIVAQHIPHTNYGAPVQLTTADNKVYTLPGSPTPEWLGRILVMRSLVGDPLREGDYQDYTADFCMEGPSSIRITAGRTWTGDAPYVRYMAKPTVIDAATAPTLLPKDVRQAVVYTAAAMWASRGGFRDPLPYRQEAHAILWGRDGWAGNPGLIPSYKNQQAGADNAWTPWWRAFSAQ